MSSSYNDNFDETAYLVDGGISGGTTGTTCVNSVYLHC